MLVYISQMAHQCNCTVIHFVEQLQTVFEFCWVTYSKTAVVATLHLHRSMNVALDCQQAVY